MSEPNSDVKVSEDDGGTCEATATKTEAESMPGGGKESLEDLLSTLSQQIKGSDWLQQNTTEKFAIENPEVAKAYREIALQAEENKKGGEQS